MTTITIPKNLIKKDDLVIIPKKEYEQLVGFWINAEPIPKKTKIAIAKGLRQISEGKFLTSAQVKNALGL